MSQKNKNTTTRRRTKTEMKEIGLFGERRKRRFWARVRIIGGDKCWMWAGHADARGYGTFSGLRAHRIAYTLSRGQIPSGLTIDHTCRNKLCVNPSHLEPVTAEDNFRRWADLITHCAKGHEFTVENTYTSPQGQRKCRACRNARPLRVARRAREMGRCVNCARPSETYRCDACRERHNAACRRSRKRAA